jgi:ribosomal protein L30/L7E
MIVQAVPPRFPLLLVTMTRGLARKTPAVREALRILGLKRPHDMVYHRNNAATRGVVRRVS